MADAARRRWTETEFFAWLETQETRFELVGGEPRAMVGATQQHDLIVINLLAMLRERLRGGPCRPGTGDTAIRIPGGNIRYPDASVDCGPFKRDDRTASEPRLVAEVLSPSTATFDQTEKLEEYRSVATLAHVLVIDPDAPRVRLHSRGADLVWGSAPYQGIDAVVPVTGLGISLPLAELYEGLSFRARPRLVEGEAPVVE